MSDLTHDSIADWLDGVKRRVIACSGGVDSLLLATIAHRQDPAETTVVHDVTPAVPEAATARVRQQARTEGWALELIESAEFTDERYLANPRNRCYFCKSHLYSAMNRVAATRVSEAGFTLLSGANVDDLTEYRPGLAAAEEYSVRHPYVELGVTKSDIRRVAAGLGLAFADIPASPCLASRLYTGTRVTESRLRAIEIGEDLLRKLTGRDVVRCRIEDATVRVEVASGCGDVPGSEILTRVLAAMRDIDPLLKTIEADPRGYLPGRAFQLTAL